MFKRRRMKKTDYKARLALLKSRKKRVVVRKSNRYVTLQLVEYRKTGDFTLVTFNSKCLKAWGWSGSFKNTPAAYLAGFAAGKKFLEKAKDGVLDIGMADATKGGVVFAALKGLVDSGFKIPHDEKCFPDEKRIGGEVIAGYGKTKDASALPQLFEKVKKNIGGSDDKRKEK